MMTLQYWYMLPVAVLFATIAMASGVGGAAGHLGRGRDRPRHPESDTGGRALRSGPQFSASTEHKDVDRMDTFIMQDYGGEKAETSLTTAEGEEIRYTVCNRTEGRLIAGVGGLFVGLISTGLGELNGYFLLQRCRVPSKVSVATSVFVVALTVLFASAGHFVRLAQTGGEVLTTVLSLVIFTVPGVILGAQLGSRVASHIPQNVLERGLGVLFILVAALTLGEVIL